MIMNGLLVRGAAGVAGEFGHVALVPNGLKCRCGNTGCWEVLASNAAAVRYYTESSAVHKGAIGSKSDMARIPFSDLLRLVEQDDARACKAVDKMAHHLGHGLSMLVTGLAPDVLVVVGDVTRIWSRVGPVVENAVKRRSFTHAPTKIMAADPDNQPRLRGAIALVLQKHFGAPIVA
jgi:predicted NBD/HSP70 family sugar kinase